MGRAWCFQERVLASRTLHFASRQMYWECEHGFDEERNATGLIKTKNYDEFSVKHLADRLKSADRSPHPDAERQAWFWMIRQYSSRELKEQSDRLPALSGVLSELKKRLPGDKCYAGIWKSWFVRGMLWRLQDPKIDSDIMVPRRPYKVAWRAPSWSFISLEGVVLYETFHDASDTCAKLLECCLTPKSKLNPLGALTAGHAIISAPVVPIVSIESQTTRKGTPCMIQLKDGSLAPAVIFFDIDRPETAKALMITPHLGIAIVPMNVYMGTYMGTYMDTYMRVGMISVDPLWNPVKEPSLLRRARQPERFLRASALPEPITVTLQ